MANSPLSIEPANDSVATDTYGIYANPPVFNTLWEATVTNWLSTSSMATTLMRKR